jgi:hypothetical protein
MKHGYSGRWFVGGTMAIFDPKKMECRSFMGLQLAHADPANSIFRDFLKVAGSLISSGSSRAATAVA